MHDIPSNFDLGFCVGSDLEQVAVGKYDLQLCFDSGARISLQCTVRLLQKNSLLAEWNEDAGWSSVAFQRLLNERVESGRVVAGRVIELQFPNDLVLQLHASSEQFESMQIHLPDPTSPLIVI